MKISQSNLKWNGVLIPLNLSKVDSIALHHMAHSTATIQEVHNWHLNNGWVGFGYNYFVDKKGNIYEGRGLNKGAGVSGHNSHVINVGFQGDYQKDTMPEKQYNAGVWLGQKLMKDISSISIVEGHNHWNSTSCPGNKFPLNSMKRDILGGDSMINKVRDFQRRNDLIVDGIVGAKTRQKAIEVQEVINYILRDEKPIETNIGAYRGVSITGRLDYPTLRLNSRGASVEILQRELNNAGYNAGAVDGIFGGNTDSAVRQLQKNNGLVVDGIVGQATWGNLLVAHVMEVNPMQLRNEVVKRTGNSIQGSFINSIFFDMNTMQPLGNMVNDGKVLAKQKIYNEKGQPHDFVKRGNFIVYNDGAVDVKMIMDIEKEIDLSKVKFAVSGFNMNPLNLNAEWWGNDVAYSTWRSMLGYNSSTSKVGLVVMANCSAQRGANVMATLGFDKAIGLDSGASTNARFKGNNIRLTGRTLYGIIRV